MKVTQGKKNWYLHIISPSKKDLTQLPQQYRNFMWDQIMTFSHDTIYLACASIYI